MNYPGLEVLYVNIRMNPVSGEVEANENVPILE